MSIFRRNPPPIPAGRSKIYDLLPPPFTWIQIPAGQVTLVNDWEQDKVYLKLNRPQTFRVSAFAIAKYPVTNAQYSKFIEAGGYAQPRWWTKAGWARRGNEQFAEPRFWRDAKWTGPDYPVVGVSWYEAMAYCRWLSEASGEAVRLPTEQEWQRAAQGDDGRDYPWGKEWDGSRCNNSAPGYRHVGTTPVTQYEGKGDSPFGVTDLIGNAGEWCLTQYYSGKQDVEGTDFRVVRGGTWGDDLTSLFRVSARNRLYPDVALEHWGFRLARS